MVLESIYIKVVRKMALENIRYFRLLIKGNWDKDVKQGQGKLSIPNKLVY